ncbi:unnamed protein product [Effrenium voratum]|nr:unnamed protein product [Effrenium voratum]
MRRLRWFAGLWPKFVYVRPACKAQAGRRGCKARVCDRRSPHPMGGHGVASARGVAPSLRLLGRAASSENGDVCGLYTLSAWTTPQIGQSQESQGNGATPTRAVYSQVGTGTVITFRRDRWVIDREGVRDSDMAVAWAKDNGDRGPPRAGWHVFSGSAGDFLLDTSMAVIDAPDVTLISQRADMNGEYRFTGLSDGYPLYSKDGMIIRYHPEGRKWLVADKEHKGTTCLAYAEAMDTLHPGYAQLQWHFWDAERGQWIADSSSHCLAAPKAIHILGRHPQACNARICGTYHLAGLREGRPLYLLPGKKAVIRYAADSDRWLIDFEALAEPGILGRILNWALSKDNSECSAFAAALNSFHPGHLELEWYVWETQQSRAALDVNVRAFSAPSKLCVVGRATSSENGDIAGDYFLCPETHKAWPAFRKKNSTMAIRREQTRWVIDRDGLRDSLICTAFASATPGFQHAGDGGSQKWHVYDSRSGSHLLDPNLQVLTDALEGDKSDSEPASKKRRECVPASHAQFGA